MNDGDDCGTVSGTNEWQEKQKYFGGNMPQCRSVQHKSPMTRPGGKPATKCLSYGTALIDQLLQTSNSRRDNKTNSVAFSPRANYTD
jgi:hypothetical protein